MNLRGATLTNNALPRTTTPGAKTGAALVVDALRRAAKGEAWLEALAALQRRYLLP